MTQPTEARNTFGLFAYPTIQQFGIALLDLLFPASCVHCGRVDTGFCATCYAELTNTPVLSYTTATDNGIRVASSGEHQGVLQSAVQALKYHNQRELAVPLGQRLAHLVQHLDWSFDMVVPVPMHLRYRERGYNQAQECNDSGETIVCRCEPIHERIRMTQSQVGLNREAQTTSMILPHAELVTQNVIVGG
jgi:predicted amidophosphoribosyltransferase